MLIQNILFPSDKIIPAHVDEPSVVETAYNISQGSLNPNFFRYPAGHMNLLAIVFKISSVFISNFSLSIAYQISWFLSNIMMAMIPALVFITCFFIQSYSMGLIGGIISLTSKLIFQHSQFAIVDVSFTFFSTLFFTVLIYYYQQKRLSMNQLAILSILLGAAIAMKYTAALLIIPFSIIIFYFIERNYEFKGSEKFQVRILNLFGLFGLMVGLMLLTFQNIIINSIANLTTDGIVEIEYVQVFSQVSFIIILGGIGLIVFDYFRKKNSLKWSGNILSPIFIKLIFLTIIIFTIFSPFTIIEYKKSFVDFMYEYRHMKIGSAAQYHHHSPEYISMIQNQDSLYPMRFYINLFVSELGHVGILFLIYGLYTMFRLRNAIHVSMISYLIIVLITIFNWQNVATRYTLNILPLMHVSIAVGIYHMSKLIQSRIGYSKPMMMFMITLVVLISPIFKIFSEASG